MRVTNVGLIVGPFDGRQDGLKLGLGDGLKVGTKDGLQVENNVGSRVGFN